MATLQVRSIDNQLYKALGRRAAQDNRSISQEVDAILQEYLSQQFHYIPVAAILQFVFAYSFKISHNSLKMQC